MDDSLKISFKERFELITQRFLGHLTFPVWGSFFFFLIRIVGYKNTQLREVRKQYQELLKASNGAVILCANHLTKIDSALITWSLGSMWSYLRSFRTFSWNLPERTRYFSNFFLRLICYFGSCIPVDRGGERSRVNSSLRKIRYLLHQGHIVTIFPEGKRSRDGKVDVKDYSYGVGQLIKTVENCKVICIYLRGYGQKTFSSVPRLGDKFYCEMKLIKPESVYQGMRGARDLAKQVVDQLHSMEEKYFALCR